MSAVPSGERSSDALHWLVAQTDNWYEELLGQPAVLATFDPLVAAASIPRSDVGTAKVIAEKFGRHLTFVDLTGVWHVWDGRVHAPTESPAVIKALLEVFAAALAEALSFVEEYYEAQAQAFLAAGGQSAQRDADRARAMYRNILFKDHRYYRDKTFSSGGVNSLLTALETKVTVPSDFYNDDRRWLVARNGVIDLDTLKVLGENEFPTLLEHSADRPVTRFFDADYDVTARADEWHTFLGRSVPNVDDRRFLMKAAGAAFMAVPKLKVIPNLQGPPDSGKSLFTDVLFMLGQGYCVEPDASALLKSQGTNFEQDKLRNKRFVAISEPDEKIPLDNGFMKKVSGGDWTETRTLHAKSTGWYPQCVMFIASNHPVKFNTRDTALLDRVSLIKFPVQFLPGAHIAKEYRRDDGLKDKLLAEASGILNWIIWGMKYYLSEGMEVTQQIIDGRREMQSAGSTALQWIAEWESEGWIKVLDETEAFAEPKSHFIGLKDGYTQYRIWADEAGEKYPLTRKYFSMDIQSRYGATHYSGVTRLPRIVWTDEWFNRHLSPADGPPVRGF